MKKVAVILSGCGFKDGSEIHESVLAMLGLEQAGAVVSCFAPEQPQTMVVNHRTGATIDAERSVIDEAARIARGEIKPLKDLSPADFDAVVLPGGFGAAMNLCDFASKGAEMSVNPDLEKFLMGMHEAGKPIGAICIAPVILAKVFGRQGARITIGTDKETAAALTKLGVQHVDCSPDDMIVDDANKLVTTPAYMLGASVGDVAPGIFKLTKEVVRLTKDS